MMKTKLLVIAGMIIILVLLIWGGSKIKIKKISPNKDKPQGEIVDLSKILTQSAQEVAKGDLPEAILSYKKLINNFPNSPQVSNWQKKLWDLNLKLLFSPAIAPGSILYEIKPGDSLDKIARKFKTTIELLKKSNGLSGDVIIQGKSLKVCAKIFNIVVDKSQNILILKSDDEIIKIYVVSTGLNNSTPVGIFKIVNKLVRPPWFKAGAMVPPESPDNILGSHWMGFDLAGYGIHGTTEPQTLGQQITQGCVRMSNSEVEELYAIVPVGTEVTIVD
ncbi:MAG: L,D-transpeptidase family protein [Candidatus Omnitrophota bacterium]